MYKYNNTYIYNCNSDSDMCFNYHPCKTHKMGRYNIVANSQDENKFPIPQLTPTACRTEIWKARLSFTSCTHLCLTLPNLSPVVKLADDSPFLQQSKRVIRV